jgi:cobalt-zinc-cadmium efflux system outer membrane protein
MATGFGFLPTTTLAQTGLTWQQVKERFQTTNPTLQAARLSTDESRAAEITAYLRPNPEFTLLTDGTQISPYEGVWRPFTGTMFTTTLSYLHERWHKRELRFGAARESTAVSEATYSDQQRTLLFNLRNAFVQVLQAKAVLQNSRENLDYWDRELDLNRTRFRAGDLSRMDLNRQELQRVQFESDFETATVNLRTAKIQLITLLNDRTPIDQFDVTGLYDFIDSLSPLEEFRRVALGARPDLSAATRNIELAKINHQLAMANGSTDPTFSGWYSHNPSFNNPFAYNTVGGSIMLPLRVFDRNQGEKARTLIDIRRNERVRDAIQAQIFSDVASAYVALVSGLNLLRTYKSKYVPLAIEVRDTVSFSYQRGGASLLEYLDSEKSYRDTRLAYLNLIGSYLIATAQMNMAVGREVITQ